MGIPRFAHIESVTDDRKVLNHGAPCQRLTLFDASRHSLLPNLAPHYAYIITCIDKQCERGFNSLYSHFTFNGKRPLSLPPSSFWNIIYLLRGYVRVYNVIVDTLPWTATQIATFRAMNMDPFNNNNAPSLYSYFIDWNIRT